MKEVLLSVFVFLSFTCMIWSQDDGYIKRKYYQAEQLVEYGNFEEALTIYKELLENDLNNANLSFKVGYCYLNTTLEKRKAVQYFEKALPKVSDEYNPDDYMCETAPYETYYYLGEAYHLDYKFSESIDVLESLKLQIPDLEEDFLKKIDSKIIQCKNGIELMKYPVKMTVNNLGKGINTEYKEHSPVFSADESVLIFTSKREGSTGGKISDGQYYEDIYISYKNDNGTWSDPQGIGANINTGGHEASIGLSVDGQQLFIYRDDNGDGNIYYSKLDGDVWTKPVKLPESINTKYNETHASLSADGSTLFFTSDRKGGYGGLDIYMVKKLPNGEWGLAQNLGSEINTSLNERCPFIHPDNVTLFFSSQGHFNMGGFDIFFSMKDEEGKWQEPTNMGYPVNTTEDDVFYTPTPDGKRAYYASQQSGSIGSTDLYIISLPGSEEKPLTVMSGLVTLSNGQQPEDVYIEVSDNETGDIVGTYTPNSKSGKYLFILTPGRSYLVHCEAGGFEPYEEVLEVPDGSSYQQIQRAIILNPIIFGVKDANNNDSITNNNNIDNTSDNQDNLVDNNDHSDSNINPDTSDLTDNTKSTDYGSDLVLSAVFFDFDMHTTEKHFEMMDKLAGYMIKNPQAVIEIAGHTDAQGDEDYNMLLGKWRAEFVKNYLIKKGVDGKALNIKSYGETKQISTDIAPFTRKYNRRVEFRIVTPGNAKLIIETIIVPDEYKLK